MSTWNELTVEEREALIDVKYCMIATNFNALMSLASKGLVEVVSNRTLTISLTENGRAVASQQPKAAQS
jgi:Mn-dependent DtxR family transcriptional regulator